MNRYALFCCCGLLALLASRASAQMLTPDERGASVLVYNFYSSNPTALFHEDTRLVLTNTSETSSVTVHLFFIGNDCEIADAIVSLTASQTLAMLASDVDPGMRGYLIAVAVSMQTGCPIKFNSLIGEAALQLRSGHRAVLAAEGIQALRDNPAECNGAANAAELKFDGVRYGVLPRVLALDHIASLMDGNNSLLVLNRIGGDLRDRAATTGTLFGLLYDDAESAYSFSIGGGCQVMGNIFASQFPRRNILPWVVPSGRSGWLKIYNNLQPVPLLGAELNYNANAQQEKNAFNSGRNLHHLTYTEAGTLTIPISPPNR